MNCKKCGYLLQPGQVICPNCNEQNNLEPEKKKIPKWLIIILAIIILLPAIITLVIIGISASNVNSTIIRSKNNAFIENYRTIKSQVETNIAMEIDCSCKENCESMYDYSVEDFNVNVTDKGSYCEITYEVNDKGKYNGVNLTDEFCSKINNASCTSDSIKGKVFK